MINKITDIVNELIQWVQSNELTLLILGAVSIVTFIGTLILVPVLVIRLPADYFAHPGRRRRFWFKLHPLLRPLLVIAKNLLGLVLLVAGIFMLVLPGQGILTILIALTLIDFPGKFAFERWLVTRPSVLKSINWLRRRAGREHLVLFDRDKN